MEYRQNHDLFGLGRIENGIGEAACPNTSNFLVLDRVTVRVFGNKFNCTVNLRDKLNSKTRLTLLVPQCCVVKLGLGSGPKDDL